jgi:phenylpropionate dioxygenase-like ring-hydroxylating dioxygenase large terminal subunit
MIAAQPVQALRDQFWHLLCHRSELPNDGDYLKLEWLGEEVVVYNDQGELLAFDNLCPHRGTRFFTEAQGNEPLACPYHGWSYRAGSMHIPCRERYAPAELKQATLKTLQLEWCADFLFAAPAPHMALEQQLGSTYALLADISFNIAGRSDINAYMYECDWRIALENALEPLHVPFVHAESLSQLQLGDGQNQFTDWTSVWQAEVGNQAMTSKLRSIKRLFQLDQQYEGYQSLYLFPFTMLSSTYSYSYSLQHFFPSDQAARTHFCSRLLNGAARPTTAAALQSFFDSSARMNRQVFDEDHAICKRIAKGAADDPRFSILSVDEEKIAHFRACLRTAKNI